MACYSYSSGSIINFIGNVQITHPSSGTTYTFSSLAWLCELPASDQICVFTTATVGGTETQLAYSAVSPTVAGYFRISGENIIINAAPGGQVIIRRCTNSEKMLFKFVDGAKLTAKQLNASLHQLLFLTQEKEFLAANHNYIYPMSSAILAWNSGTTYAVLNYASHVGQIWQATQASTNQTPQAGSAYWTAVAFASTGFHLIGATPGIPLTIDLTSNETGRALVWNGTKFVVGFITGTLNDLDDVVLGGAVTGDILVKSATNWVNVAPTIDITVSPIKFPAYPFLTNAVVTSYTHDNTGISAPAALDLFKNGSEWVLTNPPTVYHILKKSIPSQIDPITWFNTVQAGIDSIAANAGNPVKVKLEWDLGLYRGATPNTLGNINSERLNNYKSAYWEDPKEFYTVNMWSSDMISSSLKFHGVSYETGGVTTVYRTNPFMYQSTTGGATTTDSTFFQYGLIARGFYLNVPESCSTNLRSIPAVVAGGNGNTFTTISTYTNNAGLSTELNKIWDPTNSIIDSYLQGIRDYAFASIRDPTTYLYWGNSKQMEKHARYMKGKMISCSYSDFENISYKRLEQGNDSPSSALWKMPAVMIYYNRAALALGNRAVNQGQDTDTVIPGTDLAKQVRFNTFGSFHGDISEYPNSTTTSVKTGYPHKGDLYWDAWVSKWEVDIGETDESVYSYGQADIDWMYSQMGPSANALVLNDLAFARPETMGSVSTAVSTHFGGKFYPWSFRPNQFKYYVSQIIPTNNAQGGTHLFNIDANKLFSESDQVIPRPMDEYVFRVVCSQATSSLFINNAALLDGRFKHSVILEHGFTSNKSNSLTTVRVGNEDIYAASKLNIDTERIRYQGNRNEIKVFLRGQHVEEGPTAGTYLVVFNLCIQVPRAKYIGYSRIFRHYDTNQTAHLMRDQATADTDKEGGPWNFGRIDTFITSLDLTGSAAVSNTYTSSTGVPHQTTVFADAFPLPYSAASLGGVNGAQYAPLVSGRNECAAKFVRLGIPSNLWIKMSVLNTDGTVDPLTNDGIWTV